MLDIVIFLVDLAAACVVTVVLTRIGELICGLLGGESGDLGGGGWRYRPAGPRGDARRPARGGACSSRRPRRQVRRYH
jgi:hypothetical protein